MLRVTAIVSVIYEGMSMIVKGVLVIMCEAMLYRSYACKVGAWKSLVEAFHTTHSFVHNAHYLCEPQAAYFLLCVFMRLYPDDCVRCNMMPHCAWITHTGLVKCRNAVVVKGIFLVLHEIVPSTDLGIYSHEAIGKEN